MALTRNAHLTKSHLNEQFAASIDPAGPTEIEWAITIKFYSALHFVQAYFVSRSSQPPKNHATRLDAIMADPLVSGALRDYRKLWDLSQQARYEYVQFDATDLRFADDLLQSVKSVVRLHL